MEIVAKKDGSTVTNNTGDAQQQNAQVLANELAWLSEAINLRVALHFDHETPHQSLEDLAVPELPTGDEAGPYATFVRKHGLGSAERLVLALGLAPHIKPAVLDLLSTKNKDYDWRFSEFGGLYMEGHVGLVPTAETAMFLLAGDDITYRAAYQHLFRPGHVLARIKAITQQTRQKGSPRLSGTWLVAHQYVDYLVSGQSYVPEYGEDFPAQQITTQLDWDDLVLPKPVADSLQELRDWMAHGQQVMEGLGLGKRLKPGYKSLFYGPPGTGKTMAAALLGKSTDKPVYRVDLSMTVSKYIGETEKNLAKVFDQAQSQDWILFFDEADSLFGQRTQVNSANDRYGNQEIGYLLQRIEDFPGVVVLASNLKDNIDPAFTRRFQSMVEFCLPGVAERHQLWQQSFSDKLPLAPAIDLWALAERHEVSGGVIMNVVRKATLRALASQQATISHKVLETAIRQERHKEGIILG